MKLKSLVSFRKKVSMKLQKRLSSEQIEQVVQLLGDEFELDGHVRQMMRKTLTAYDGTNAERFEFILDHPGVARWRLKPDTRDNPLGLRVGYHGFSHSDTPPARQEELNQLVAAIVSGE